MTDTRKGAVLRRVALAVLLPCLGLTTAFVICDFTQFQPRRARIAALLAAAHPEEISPPPLLVELQRWQPPGSGDVVAHHASRLLLLKLDDGRSGESLRRHAHSFLWMQLVDLHLTEHQQLLLIRSLSYMGNGDYGFQASATKGYGRPLSELDDLQLAKLVVIARWPTYYRHQAQAGKLEQAAERLLSQVRPGRHAPSPADVSDAR